MRILGLDLADKTGISVIDSTGKLLFSKSIKLSKKDPQMRVFNLFDLLSAAIGKYSPNVVAIEDVFLPAKTSRKTPISLGELRGVARLCAAQAGLPVYFYAAKKIKLSITGYGNAQKSDVIHWIENEFQTKVEDDNEADAISVAYTHLLISRFESSFES